MTLVAVFGEKLSPKSATVWTGFNVTYTVPLPQSVAIEFQMYASGVAGGGEGGGRDGASRAAITKERQYWG